ncbi:MAG: hypothetical protein ACXVCJ_09945 [Polyangiales bacterium]
MRMRSFVPWVLVASTALGGIGIGPVLAQNAIKEPGWPPPEGAACKPSKKDTEDAKSLFKLGKDAREAGNYTDAIKYFKDAYKRDCSAHLLLKLLAQAYELDAQFPQAVEAYKLYRTRQKPTGEELDLLDTKITNLSKKLGDTGASGSTTATTPATGTAPTTTATATETAPTGTVTTAPTGTTTAPPPSHGPGIAPWIVVGVGGAALIGGTVLWITSNSTVSKKSDEFAANSCGSNPKDRATCNTIADDGKSAKSNRTVGIIVAGVGVAAVGAGLAWYFVGSSAEKKAAKLTITPGPTFAGLGLAGVF